MGYRNEHVDRAELILEQLEEQWHVGEPHQRILLAHTHALLAVAEALGANPSWKTTTEAQR